MRYSFMTFSTPEASFTEVVQIAAKYGYDGIEPRTDRAHAHGVEVAATKSERAAIKDEARKAGIALACLATSLRYADPANEATAIAETHERIDLASDVGAPAIRVFGGVVPDDISRNQAIAQVAKCLKAVADHAAERNVIVTVETHDDWCDPNHMAAVLKEVDHPAIACNWDVMHPVRRVFMTVEDAFEILRPWIKHTHVHDGVWGPGLQLLPIGEGRVDHRAFVRLLQESGYEGFLSGEWIRWDDIYETYLPRELATLKSYEN